MAAPPPQAAPSICIFNSLHALDLVHLHTKHEHSNARASYTRAARLWHGSTRAQMRYVVKAGGDVGAAVARPFCVRAGVRLTFLASCGGCSAGGKHACAHCTKLVGVPHDDKSRRHTTAMSKDRAYPVRMYISHGHAHTKKHVIKRRAKRACA